MGELRIAFFFSYSVAYLWLAYSDYEGMNRWYSLLRAFFQALLPFAYWVWLGSMHCWVVVGIFALLLALMKNFSTWFQSPPPLFGFIFIQVMAGAFGFGLVYKVSSQSNNAMFAFFNRIILGSILTPSVVKMGLLHSIALLWVLWGGTIFVRSVLHPFALSQKSIPNTEWQRGKVIGYLERLLIYILVQFHLPSMITLIVGLKAVARFKQLEEREFAEYFLIGTLASLLFALGVAFAVRFAVPSLHHGNM